MTVTCVCGAEFEARHPRARYCSARCRQQKRRGGPVVELPAKGEALGPVGTATRRELQAAGVFESAKGQMCMTLAARLDTRTNDTGSAVAAVAARLDSMLVEATRAVRLSAPQLLQDELAARRVKHGA